jgi:hypothetical protein
MPNSGNQSLFKSFVGRSIPAVRADDVRRVWSFLSEEVHRSGPGVGVNLKLLADLCDANANVLAVWVRAMLVMSLTQHGRLDGWREGNSLGESVFELAARFPLSRGLGNVDPDAFVAALK